MVKKIVFHTKDTIHNDYISSRDFDHVYINWYADLVGGLLNDPGALYKFRGIDLTDNVVLKKVKKKKTVEKKKLTLEREYVVELGGPFEKIGDDNETIGGGSQKLG